MSWPEYIYLVFIVYSFIWFKDAGKFYQINNALFQAYSVFLLYFFNLDDVLKSITFFSDFIDGVIWILSFFILCIFIVIMFLAYFFGYVDYCDWLYYYGLCRDSIESILLPVGLFYYSVVDFYIAHSFFFNSMFDMIHTIWVSIIFMSAVIISLRKLKIKIL